MRLSKEFLEWYEDLLNKGHYTREDVFGDKNTKVGNGIIIPVKWLEMAFQAHDKELNRLRKFEKKFRTLQSKLRESDEKRFNRNDITGSYDIKYDRIFANTLEEILYL